MAKAQTPEAETTSTEIVKTEAEILSMLDEMNRAQWDIVYDQQPDQIKPDTLGDQIIGVLLRKTWVTPKEINTRLGTVEEGEPFLVLTFRNVLVGNMQAGPSSYSYMENGFVNAGHALEQAFKDIEVQTPCRLTLVNFRDVDQASPMNEWRVETPTRQG